MLTLYENIQKYRNLRGMSQEQLAELVGYKDRTSIAKIEAGNVDLSNSKIRKFAEALSVSEIELLGLLNDEGKTSQSNRIKVYGSVPAGIPLEAIEDVVDWEDIPLDWSAGGNEFIGLRVKGDSMAPKYVDGDTVIVKIQPDCESGQDAVIYVNGYEATLKKLIKKTDCIILQPLNPSYEPKVYDYNDEDNPINILGVVVELRRKIWYIFV